MIKQPVYIVSSFFLLFPFFSFGQLHGIYTIDASKSASSANYTSIDDATGDLMLGKRSKGTANGPGVDSVVIFKIANGSYSTLKLGKIKGASQKNRITFESATGDSTRVRIIYHIDLDSASFVTIKRLTIAPYVDSVDINVRYTQNDSFIGNIIRQNRFNPNPNYCVKLSKGCRNTVFLNNKIVNGIYGIVSSNTKNNGSGLQILNNLFDSTSGSILLGNEAKFLVSKNFIKTGGLSISSSDSSWLIEGNIIYGWSNFYSCSTNSSIQSVVCNNIMSAIYITGCKGFAFVNNTINFTGSTNTNAVSLAYKNSNLIIINNIFYGSGYGGYLLNIDTASVNNKIDYNTYYSLHENFAYIYYKTYSLLKNSWLAATSFDKHSQFRDPRFKSLKDTVLVGTNPWLKTGVSNSYVSTDFFGIKRNLLHPTIGAVEIYPDSCLSGTYTIGGIKPDFSTFNAATKALDRWGCAEK